LNCHPCSLHLLGREVISKYDDQGPAWYWNTIRVGEHTGTHFDAPVHWVTGKDLPENTLDTIPAHKHVAPVCVIDTSRESAQNEDFLLTPEFVEKWEAANGRIPAGAWVLMRTDWSKRTDTASFLNLKEDGSHCPGPSVECIRLLIERGVAGFGSETVGTDAGQAHLFDPMFPCHHLIHGAGKFGLASLCNLDQLPATGAMLEDSRRVRKSGTGLRPDACVGEPVLLVAGRLPGEVLGAAKRRAARHGKGRIR